MSITTSSGRIIVDFEMKSIQGAPAIGAYLLKFSVAYSMPPHEEPKAYFHKTLAKIYVGKNNILLGIANPEQPKTFKSSIHQQKGGLLYELLISKDALDEIERIRVGEGIEFKLDIIGEYYDGLNQLCDSISIPYIANQKEWIDVLKLMEYRGGILLELPMDIRPSDEVKTALTAIEKAKEQLYYGNYDDVVAKCRISLESIISNWGDIKTVRNQVKTNKKCMSKQQRFFHAIDQIVHFTHLAHHSDEDGEYVSFTRSEAVFVLGSTMSAISSYVESKN